MFWVVFIRGDDDSSLDWFEVHGTRKEAYAFARQYASDYGLIVKRDDKGYKGMLSNGCVVVTRSDYLYFGA